MFGREPYSPISTTLPMIDFPNPDDKTFIKQLVQGLTISHEIAQDNMRHHKEKMKIQYNKKIHPVEYEV